ncbi:complex I NDUFA9 subunit family protein [Tepidimonas charontis]|uniref:N-acetyl-alpha-D-glucosaminyl-diphospho-ditrans, octacis-undecaprenol 4-epimerase n=1 Tax=Tepidimonas charontis TaxID=2267262 RepID=A0A554XEZ5_9BURK|nr:complex I NDUFA9 subunit family protein [Tepidimonas charontis]TSE34344.1 N-acetyl-alpha-D-glucosaminyl-diphospho-ditrans,octacis-undecaprenol 4-epimerase [Tepidimonas charontis]
MKHVLVLGGTGFVGRHLCEQLTRAGVRVTVPTRHAEHAKAIQMLPMVDVCVANVHDDRVLERLLPGHDAVVNLIAVLHGNDQRFQHVHVELPQRLGQAMLAAGVTRLVHVSALGADPAGPSRYLRSKGEGEAVLRALADAGLALTILRPSVIFGAEDRFLNLFARLQASLPVVPLAGAQARFQPVWVGDVARAITVCLQRPHTIGQTIEAVGPEVWTLRELVRLAGRLSGHPRPIIGLPRALAYFQALLMEWLPGEPLLTTDNLRSMEVDNVASGTLPTLADLGIQPSAVEPVAARYLDSDGPADPLIGLRRTAHLRR